ncbi:MAG: elongation factor P [Candidatus Nealsonbacteria bacterium]|nr:elongation factor P [Candidatus Nealsonbacteria bacterium]
MITHTELRRGVQIIIDGQPYEILESSPMKKAQRRVVIQSKIKNLINGNVLDWNFHQSDAFEEAEIVKKEASFLYAHKDRYFFTEKDNPSKRFDLSKDLIGESSKFLKPGQIVEEIQFKGETINISLPIKVQMKVTEAPPGIKGDRAQGGTKTVTLESGANINVPLFVEQGDIIELNTETGGYTRRVE